MFPLPTRIPPPFCSGPVMNDGALAWILLTTGRAYGESGPNTRAPTNPSSVHAPNARKNPTADAGQAADEQVHHPVADPHPAQEEARHVADDEQHDTALHPRRVIERQRRRADPAERYDGAGNIEGKNFGRSLAGRGARRFFGPA